MSSLKSAKWQKRVWTEEEAGQSQTSGLQTCCCCCSWRKKRKILSRALHAWMYTLLWFSASWVTIVVLFLCWLYEDIRHDQHFMKTVLNLAVTEWPGLAKIIFWHWDKCPKAVFSEGFWYKWQTFENICVSIFRFVKSMSGQELEPSAPPDYFTVCPGQMGPAG